MGDAPVIGVDPVGMAGPTQRLQPADVGATNIARTAKNTTPATTAM